jgi:putative membrane protein
MKSRIRMWLMVSGVAGVVGVGAGARAADQPASNPAPAPVAAANWVDPASIAVKMHRINQTEIDVATRARDNGESAKVKSFAAQIIRDHQQADRSLAAYAKKRKIDLSGSSGTSTEEPNRQNGSEDANDMHMAATVKQLKGMTGGELDRAFVSAMVVGHDQALQMVNNASANTKDRDLVALLNSFRPTLDRHRRMASTLNNTLAGTSSVAADKR